MDIKVKLGFEVSQNQILGEGHYADMDSQAIFNEHTLSLCHTTALTTWDKIQELGNIIESYTKVILGPRRTFSDFLLRLTKAIQIGVADTEARGVLIESLT